MDITLYRTFKQITDWLFPPQCTHCQQHTGGAKLGYCSQCYADLPFIEHSCQQCGQPFSGLSDHCGKCLSSPPTFDQCFCPFEYASPISDDICRLKYGDQPQISRQLASLFLNELQQYGLVRPQALVAVPMHPAKLRERGFNQSIQLAKQLGKALDIPVLQGILAKTTITPRQATQTLTQRKTNVAGSFSIQESVPYQHVAIVDDVVTTGATVEEISKILKKNGVDYIQVWGIARTR